MKAYIFNMSIHVINGDCLNILKTCPDNYFSSVVTDPPYGISFMGKKWDYDIPSVEVWQEVLRVLKPGGHALIACGTRTQHRMACNIEDAGFEIRDVVSWVYGSGFPKSMDISKAIDKMKGVEREVIGEYKMPGYAKPEVKNGKQNRNVEVFKKTSNESITEEAKKYSGYGTALKPACEFFILARKPLSEKTIAANVLKWGTGGLNIDRCRIGTDEVITNHSRGVESAKSKGKYGDSTAQETHQTKGQEQGRFPANLITDGSDEVLELFPYSKSGAMKKPYEYKNNGYSMHAPSGSTRQIHESSEGSAARFFYCAKASKKERGEGNIHPTVKPIALMEYLIKLITPPNGIVLDCYAGSGSTGLAARNLGFDCILIEREKVYCEIIKKRLK